MAGIPGMGRDIVFATASTLAPVGTKRLEREGNYSLILSRNEVKNTWRYISTIHSSWHGA
jgi:hypothetical protein